MRTAVAWTSQGFIRAVVIMCAGSSMSLFKKKKKEPAAEDEPAKKSDAHYHSSLDYMSARDKDVNCPECEKARKHVKLVENEGKVLECPECHYVHLTRR